MKKLFTGHDASVMREVPGEVSHKLHRQMISHYTLMREAAARDGIELRLVSSWRSYDQQKSIWDRKTRGDLPLLDPGGKPMDISLLSDHEICQSILNWSALPGSSRHHWGSDFDVYDASAMDISDVQLIQEEYQLGGPMEKLGTWLNHWLNSVENPGFFLPYAAGRKTGYGNEPWHLSYGPLASHIQSQFRAQDLQEILKDQPPRLLSWSQDQVQLFFRDFVSATSPSASIPPSDPVLPLKIEKRTLGQSYLNSEIELSQIQLPHSMETGQDMMSKEWSQEVECSVLILGGHHGDESEGVQILRRCLDALAHAIDPNSPQAEVYPSPRTSVAIISPLNPDGLKMGQRANYRGVDLNRNFPSSNWSPLKVDLRAHADAPRIPTLSPGIEPASEKETHLLIQTLKTVQPKLIVSIHSPLACVDQDIPNSTGTQEDLAEAKWFSRVSGLPTTQSIGYPTPGSFGSYCQEQGYPLITLELEALPREELYQKWVPIMTQFIQNKLLHTHQKEN